MQVPRPNYSGRLITQSLLSHGPLFHRWLPEGEKDAIFLNTGDPNAKLKIWFERRGFKANDGFIEFDYKRREVDTDIIPKQAIFDAGPLMGLIEIQSLTEEKLSPLVENKSEDAHCVDLAKKVVELVQAPVGRFVDVLRTNYGQYWIANLEKWDSRKMSLRAYCHRLNLQWSTDGGKTWAPFAQGDRIVYLMSTITMNRDFREYLTKDNWQELEKVSHQRFEPSLSANLLALSHQSLDQGDLKQAFIEGVTGLEIGLGEFIRKKLGDNNSLTEFMQSFWQLPLPAQLVTLTAAVGTVASDDIELSVKAIKIRNRIVHEGWEPQEDAKRELSALLRTTAMLLPGPRFKFPSINPGNELAPVEDWEKHQST